MTLKLLLLIRDMLTSINISQMLLLKQKKMMAD